MLRVDIDKPRCKIAQLLQTDGGIVYKGTRFTIRQYLATYDCRRRIVDIEFVEQSFESVWLYIECRLYDTLTRSIEGYLRIGTATQDKRKSSQNNRFTRTRLSCNDRQTIVEIDIETVDESVIVDSKIAKHTIECLFLFNFFVDGRCRRIYGSHYVVYSVSLFVCAVFGEKAYNLLLFGIDKRNDSLGLRLQTVDLF